MFLYFELLKLEVCLRDVYSMQAGQWYLYHFYRLKPGKRGFQKRPQGTVVVPSVCSWRKRTIFKNYGNSICHCIQWDAIGKKFRMWKSSAKVYGLTNKLNGNTCNGKRTTKEKLMKLINQLQSINFIWILIWTNLDVDWDVDFEMHYEIFTLATGEEKLLLLFELHNSSTIMVLKSLSFQRSIPKFLW